MIKLCEHCCHRILERWVSDMPKPGQAEDQVRYWHMDRYACRQAFNRVGLLREMDES